MSKSIQIKVRKSWGELNPVTKRIESKRAYTRKIKHKRDFAYAE